MLIQYNLKGNLLRCVTTDPGKMHVEEDLVGEIYKDCENVRFLKPVVLCCIHQPIHCRKGLNLSHN